MAKTITDKEYEELLNLREFKKNYETLLLNANELGQLVDKLSAFAGNISRAGVKKAPAKAKTLTREQRKERNQNRLRGIK